VIITLGSAFQYYLAENDQPVANNHRMPAQLFRKKLLSTAEIETALQSAMAACRKIPPDLRFLFTISPVRHIRDGVVDNNRSKSIGAQLAIKPVDPLAFYVNYIGGPENADDNSSVRHVVDLIATLTVNPMLSLGVNADFGTEDGTSAVTTGTDARWSGFAGYAKITTSSPTATRFPVLPMVELIYYQFL
jgi:hypothetical protein